MRPEFLLTFLLAATLVACGGNRARSDGPGSGSVATLPGDAIPRPEERSRYGNGPVYEVLGKRYTVMPDSADYRERGVASWYGKKFHGRLTSNREVYDMYAMTAAHKSLPLPTYVQVRNLRNNKMIVVRVNDRGPFVDNRIIDLSYSAALKLDMIKDGTSMVEVSAIRFAGPQGDYPTSDRMPPRPTPAASQPAVSLPAESPSIEAQPAVAEPAVENRIFVQVGAFGEHGNATRRLTFLSQSGIRDAFIHEDNSAAATLFRVRIGPVADVLQYDLLVEELGNIGIKDPYLISD